jgi:phosphatidylglycerol---prolipoprotein diacylglyceryl transferase
VYPRIYITNSYTINVYSLTYVIAITIALIVSYIEVKRYRLPLNLFPAGAFWTVLSGMIGNKIFFIIFFSWDIFVHHPWRTLTDGNGGMYYGAEIGGGIGLLLFAMAKKISAWKVVDVAGMALMISHGLGRIGCYLAGCCYGTETNSVFGVTFPGMRHPVHPTQLYETVPLLIAFTVFWFLRKKIKIPGIIYFCYVLFYSIIRFIIEYYRDDAYKYGILNLSPSQYIALIMALIAVVLLTVRIKSGKTAAVDEDI